jgi:hypothetical protein
MKRIHALSILTLCLALTAWGQVRTAPRAARTAPPRTAATAGRATAATPRLSDAEIEKDIRARLARSKIHTDGFKVRVQGGVATLDGRTGVIQHKGVATRMAKNAGATRVVNQIEISQEARDRANANLAKGRRRAQVKRTGARSDRTSRRQGT